MCSSPGHKPHQQECGTMLGNDRNPYDHAGCLLPEGHSGPHEFVDSDGVRWQWETDWECDCEHCLQCEGDYCTIYWRAPLKAPQT